MTVKLQPNDKVLRAPLLRAVAFTATFDPLSPVSQEMVYYEDEQCLVIYDKHPKAKYHLLLMGKVRKGSALLLPGTDPHPCGSPQIWEYYHAVVVTELGVGGWEGCN